MNRSSKLLGFIVSFMALPFIYYLKWYVKVEYFLAFFKEGYNARRIKRAEERMTAKYDRIHREGRALGVPDDVIKRAIKGGANHIDWYAGRKR